MISRRVGSGLIGLALLLWATTACAEKLSPLGRAPDWSEMDKFQHTISRDDFSQLLKNVYAPDEAFRNYIEISADRVRIKQNGGAVYELKFAASAAEAKPVPRYWKPAAKSPVTAKQPLAGLKIALDPGHIGGKWAKMEERWFQIGDAAPVTEGDMTLLVAKLIAPQLRELGAEVFLVRDSTEPLAKLRPEQLRSEARAELERAGVKEIREDFSGATDPLRQNSIRWQAEKLFYRVSEIRERARRVNEDIKPDLTLALHFNAEHWGDPDEPRLVEIDHLHLIVNGNYSADELSYDDIRFEMLIKLLTRCYPEAVAVSDAVAESMAKATGLPPYIYPGMNARPVQGKPYLWTRNLLANRLYQNPVVYIEPYVMNSREVFERIQLGDYDGETVIDGVKRKSIFREYADAVVAGVRDYYSPSRSVIRDGE